MWLWGSMRTNVRTPTTCKPMPNVRLFLRKAYGHPRLVKQTQLRDGPLENLSGGGGAKKKKFVQGKIK